eukprot:2175035-Rhodomonas_salina.1
MAQQLRTPLSNPASKSAALHTYTHKCRNIVVQPQIVSKSADFSSLTTPTLGIGLFPCASSQGKITAPPFAHHRKENAANPVCFAACALARLHFPALAYVSTTEHQCVVAKVMWKCAKGRNCNVKVASLVRAGRPEGLTGSCCAQCSRVIAR